MLFTEQHYTPEMAATIRKLRDLPLEELMATLNAMDPEYIRAMNQKMATDPASLLEQKKQIALDNIKHGRPWSME